MGKQSPGLHCAFVLSVIGSHWKSEGTTETGSVLFFLNRITCCSFSVLTKGKQSSEVAIIMLVRVWWIGP